MLLSVKELKQEAKKKNIIDIGVIRPNKSPLLKKLIEDRHANQYLTNFEEISIDKRIDASLIMPEAKSVIVAAMSYFNKEETDVSYRPLFCGSLARFSRGTDYHRVLKMRLSQLMESIPFKEEPYHWLVYADTGPLVDRHLAAEAGLGYFGRNNCFFHSEYGSYIVIGYVVTSLEFFEEDYRSMPYLKCNECGKCQRACPVNAITTPFVINNQRCLANQLQQKGVMDSVSMKKSGTMLYGCDICQDVCPNNKGIRETSEKMFYNNFELAWINLEELLNMNNKEFKKRYESMAFAWRGLRVMKRNALKSLGNMGNPMAIPIIEPFVDDEREDINNAAKWALKQLTLA
ncbi:tRNA epoxyqueuosine(34) reductase QueG [Tindallia californiensis]|uniref:Epoxyqueuosine reductase n=1 Tax=Tindallia californiensis TaxID=159292 RepID=A0A1H3IAI0_9FIRM|nr:tRNA epoxyqueuosine(34) reductase QueG [Tindallia californiensis]SDY24707.1 epoxyqueuosine reductase [Tindallia californiensis]